MADLRVVLDTNILLAIQRAGQNSPNLEIFARWEKRQFEVLWSRRIIAEYIAKSEKFPAKEKELLRLITLITAIGTEVHEAFPSPYVSIRDQTDAKFIRCAVIGKVTHIVTYDEDLLVLDTGKYPFKICKPVPFLKELRTSRGEKETP